jgi:hypothetical protein
MENVEPPTTEKIPTVEPNPHPNINHDKNISVK